ncbi:deoxyguanosinetriphosphate triphosphohydrolase [Rhodoferax lacus]|uniref:Deoxyguanosinetriphosphate triphosphohydrolase-like protein n=1 Tax=Rhodoferax lacus TaxID=2184758 RepID=A0A3E1REX5_9BURK|nr:deoxyguanosinetriphosphate triphosphohydrolase [Rhodoferax lacus]RFO97926.1 deoxyguanosinetriphosphate triphosphohydrolase [Rhodoferax lacus]
MLQGLDLPAAHLAPGLASYASDPAHSRGRRIGERAPATRTEYQRDRDRIVHSTAFRRLVYKTQVFLNHEGDLFRTRLTHSLEVAQLGRSIARSLRLNEDLVEAIALAHDLGHTPFGHAGQDALHECMSEFGGFEHNLQSLRVVDLLEERYPLFDGLNLTFETREGVLKHCSRNNARLLEAAEHVYADGQGGVGQRFLEAAQPSLEAQLCNLADEIAYNAHDIDDGIRSGLITLEQVRAVPLFNTYCEQALSAHAHLHQPAQARRLMYESIRLMLSDQVFAVIAATGEAIAQAGVESPGDVRRSVPLVVFGSDMQQRSAQLKSFLFAHLYRHPQVVHTMSQAKQVVRELFDLYCVRPGEMQAGFALRSQATQAATWDAGPPLQRSVADYIAGMTDRFASREHHRLTGQHLLTGAD